ncbi:carbohydrate ABC transporter permease [Microbacterium sp. cx-55]|uniref:carbohydrate ABC transporter permease n=1 Tax=Microbacterium sp. cx-55 TaxID=2875948 RepID=UPI001CBF2CFF|nr:carbohydrate ABC transporter permease [Microbacterium sp. cx-55]MBZ4487760.1 carbohydrate ABC transporter permease [Microbacterium sp. cx-55]UGB34828.1 carbohydrate ABC transporter permease [Microbacterium sp. cx-55]
MTAAFGAPAPLAAHSASGGRRRRGARVRVARILLHVVILTITVTWFTPVLQMIAMSLRTTPDSASSGWWTIFAQPLITLDNFAVAAKALRLDTTLLATLTFALPAAVITLLLSAYGGYALSRWRFRGNLFVYGTLVALLAIPPQLAFSPLIQLFSAVGLNGTPAAVWIFQVAYTLPFGVFLVRGYMYTIPIELFEAAAVDGASELRIFLRIVLPLSAPILVSLAILQFMWSWNDLLTPLIFVGVSSDSTPITVQLSGLAAQISSNGTNTTAAGALISVLPPLVILLALQRYFVAGITGGAIK